MAKKYICKHCGATVGWQAAFQHMQFTHHKKVLFQFIQNHYDTVEE
jgi:hypothetical protein